VEFLFFEKCACLLYELAVLLICMRFELWGGHLARLRELRQESGLGCSENTFWRVVRTWGKTLVKSGESDTI